MSRLHVEVAMWFMDGVMVCVLGYPNVRSLSRLDDPDPFQEIIAPAKIRR